MTTPSCSSSLSEEEKREEPVVTTNTPGTATSMDKEQLHKELDAAKVDAQESLQAVLELSKGLRMITRQLQHATQDGNPHDNSPRDDDSCEKEEEAESVTSSLSEYNSCNPECFVASSCLQGTVFGTDLLRLWDAAQQVQSYARLVAEESTISAKDVTEAQSTALEAAQRAQRAESRVGQLATKCQHLTKRNAKLLQEKRVLVQEVKSLRQQLATSRKQEMERLLQHHVAGALLLHEEQLKLMLQQQRQREAAAAASRIMEEEEEKKEEEVEENDTDMVLTSKEDAEPDETDQDQDLQVIQPNDASESEEVNRIVDSDAIEKALSGDVADGHCEIEKVENAQSTQRDRSSMEEKNGDSAIATTPTRGTPDPPVKTPPPTTVPSIVSPPSLLNVFGFGGGSGVSAQRSGNANIAIQRDSKPVKEKAPLKDGAVQSQGHESKAVEYNPIKLLAKGRRSPVPHEKPQQQQRGSQPNAPDSSRSLNSASSAVPEHDIHVGKKVMRFFLDPEAHAAAQEAAARAKKQQQLEQQKLRNNKPLLHLHTHNGEQDTGVVLKSRSMSGDGTAITAAATPSSSCLGLAKLGSYDTPVPLHNNNSGGNEKPLQLPVRLVPSSVSFSSDSLSIQSNLPSPLVHRHHSPCNDSPEDQRQRQEIMELYKDLKVFRSLAIPSEDEIDDYRELTTL